MKIPKEPGHYWAKWRIADEGTDYDETLLPLDYWEPVEVFMNSLDKTHPEHLMASVIGVKKFQSIENFFWGERIKPPV